MTEAIRVTATVTDVVSTHREQLLAQAATEEEYNRALILAEAVLVWEQTAYVPAVGTMAARQVTQTGVDHAHLVWPMVVEVPRADWDTFTQMQALPVEVRVEFADTAVQRLRGYAHAWAADPEESDALELFACAELPLFQASDAAARYTTDTWRPVAQPLLERCGLEETSAALLLEQLRDIIACVADGKLARGRRI